VAISLISTALCSLPIINQPPAAKERQPHCLPKKSLYN